MVSVLAEVYFSIEKTCVFHILSSAVTSIVGNLANSRSYLSLISHVIFPQHNANMAAAKVIVAFVSVVAIVLGSEDEPRPDVPSPQNKIDDKSGCAGEFLEWCRNSSTTFDKNAGVSVLVMEHPEEEGERVRIFCMRNASGINCTKNNRAWFLCDSDGKLDYKGEKLEPEYEDEDICKTKDRARSMFRPPIPFNPTEFENQMKHFRTRMTEFAKHMRREFGFQGPFGDPSGRIKYDP